MRYEHVTHKKMARQISIRLQTKNKRSYRYKHTHATYEKIRKKIDKA